jgi:hypothetical protein
MSAQEPARRACATSRLAGHLGEKRHGAGISTSRTLSVGASVLREHRTILLLTLGYIAAGGVVLTILGRPWPIRLMNGWFAGVWVSLTIVWLGWEYLKGARYLRAALEPSRAYGAVLIAFLVLPTQITFQALKQSIGPVIGFPADRLLHQIDVAVHGQMAWLWLAPVLDDPLWVRIIDLLYMMWFAGLIVFVIWAGWTKHRVLRQRAVIALLLLWIGGGTVGAWVTASGGPCYYQDVVPGPNPYEGLLARLDSIAPADVPLRARFNQRGLWDIRREDQWAQFAGISAMPSMHVGLAVLFALVAWKCSRLLGVLLGGYAIVVQVGSVVLAWHYAIDGYAGALCAVISWWAAPALVSNSTGQRLESNVRSR